MKFTVYRVLLLGACLHFVMADKDVYAQGGNLNSNMVAAAKSLAEDSLVPSLLQNAPAQGKHRVAVFTFANKEGRYDAFELGLIGSLMQGEIYDSLSKAIEQKAKGKFTFLSPYPGLQNIFETANLEPVGIYSGGTKGARSIFKQVRIDVGIIGKFGFTDRDELHQKAEADGSIPVTITVIYPDSEKVFEASILASDLLYDMPLPSKISETKPSASSSQSLTVKMFWKKFGNKADDDSSAWKEVPLRALRGGDSQIYHDHIAIISKDQKGKRFKLQLENSTKPGAGKTAADQLNGDRMYAAAVLVDGINSLYQKTGLVNPVTKAEIKGPVIRHPTHAKKWTITAPGRKMIPTANQTMKFPMGLAFGLLVQDDRGPAIGLAKDQRVANGKLIDAEGKGDSVIDITGFIEDSNGEAKFALPFQFGDVGQTLAETTGITTSPGLIEVHVYQESLPSGNLNGDKAIDSRPRPDVDAGGSPKFRVVPTPVAVWRIHYRYEGQPLPQLAPVGPSPLAGLKLKCHDVKGDLQSSVSLGDIHMFATVDGEIGNNNDFLRCDGNKGLNIEGSAALYSIFRTYVTVKNQEFHLPDMTKWQLHRNIGYFTPQRGVFPSRSDRADINALPGEVRLFGTVDYQRGGKAWVALKDLAVAPDTKNPHYAICVEGVTKPVGIKVGEVRIIAGDYVPPNWMVCDGRKLSKKRYPQLNNEIGAVFGASDATGEIMLPDLRGHSMMRSGHYRAIIWVGEKARQ